MCSNSKTVDSVTLLIQAEDGFLVDIIGGDDGHFSKPRQLERFGDLFKRFASQHGQIRQIPAVNADAQGPIPAVVER